MQIGALQFDIIHDSQKNILRITGPLYGMEDALSLQQCEHLANFFARELERWPMRVPKS